MTDLNKAEHYMEFLLVIERTPEIKVILSILEPDALGDMAYTQYISSLCGENIELKDLDRNWQFKQKLP